MVFLLLFSLPLLALADVQPAAVTPCTVGYDKPCLPSSICTPTMISTAGQPWLGQCIATPVPTLSYPMPTVVPPPSTECHVGWADGGGCKTGSTCTPTETCYRLRPCGGKCIATATPPPSSYTQCHVGWDSGECGYGSTCTPTQTCYKGHPCGGACIATPTLAPPSSSSPPIITDYPPSTKTECHVGWGNGECGYGSTCTPTMTCYRGRPCGGACIATPTPIPSSSAYTQCHVGWDNGECNYGSTCTPTQTCTKGRPCGGACIATPTLAPPSSSSSPIITDYPPPSTKTQCHVGWGNGECGYGSTCTPTMTCYRGRPCGGACIATPAPPASTSCKD